MVELLIPVASGIVAGVVAGVLPGIGATAILLLAFPVLLVIPFESCLLFYIGLISTTQYYGSITAIALGVFGEVSSAPAASSGHKLFAAGNATEAFTLTAGASFVGSVVGVAVAVVFYYNTDLLLPLLTEKIRVLVLFLVIVMLVVTSNNVATSTLAAVTGLFAGVIGTSDVVWLRKTVFEYSAVAGGIPFIPVLIGVAVLPAVGRYYFTQVTSELVAVPRSSMLDRLLLVCNFRHFSSVLRGAVVGSAAGLIPGVSYSISANVASALERARSRYPESENTHWKTLLAAESANNAGATTVLLPLMFFGLPIVPSEAVLMSIAESRGAVLPTIMNNSFYIGVGLIAVVNLFNVILSGMFYQKIISMYSAVGRSIYLLSAVACIAVVGINGYFYNHFILSSITLLVALAFGLAIRNHHSQIVFVFAFFISAHLIPGVYRLWIIYS